MNDMNLIIVGVASLGFNYPDGAVLWKAATVTRRNAYRVVGRLKPGVSLQQAKVALSVEANLDARVLSGTRKKYPPKMIPLRESLAGPVKSASLLLMGGVALILLLACTNVANLLMARTADRFSELSIRAALGASRARITQQLLTESLLLSVVAALAGLGVALGTVAIAAKVQPAPLSSQSYSILDVRVLLFATGLSILTGLLFGILPSLHAGRMHTMSVRGASGTRTSKWIREGLVAIQVMLTIVLLAGSVAVGRTFLALLHVDRGYDTQHRGRATVKARRHPRDHAASRTTGLF